MTQLSAAAVGKNNFFVVRDRKRTGGGEQRSIAREFVIRHSSIVIQITSSAPRAM
jgi:hypothetical protein